MNHCDKPAAVTKKEETGHSYWNISGNEPGAERQLPETPRMSRQGKATPGKEDFPFNCVVESSCAIASEEEMEKEATVLIIYWEKKRLQIKRVRETFMSISLLLRGTLEK